MSWGSKVADLCMIPLYLHYVTKVLQHQQCPAMLMPPLGFWNAKPRGSFRESLASTICSKLRRIDFSSARALRLLGPNAIRLLTNETEMP